MRVSLELTDNQPVKQFLLQTWAQSRIEKLTASRLTTALRVAMELANEGEPITHLGFMSDCITALTLSTESDDRETAVAWPRPALDTSLVRRYEDYVLGKFAADMTLQRASDELHKYKDRELDRALAYVLQQIQSRAQLPGVLVSPAAVKALLSRPTSTLQTEFQEALVQELAPDGVQGLTASATRIWDEVTQAVRNCGELLGAEDIFELASGTALSTFGQRLALRQVMQAAQYLATGLPKQKPSGPKRHFAVATNVLEEDLYPVGGFSSIANRGTMESLLRSELAYMEVDDRPDLFDIRYARDELLYYSRDENQFFRRRVTIMFVLDPTLAVTRIKDSSLPWQRMVLTLGVVAAMVRALTDWLSADALKFEILFQQTSLEPALKDEQDVLEMIFQQDIQAGRLLLSPVSESELQQRMTDNARASACLVIQFHAKPGHVRHALLADRPDPTQAAWQPLVSQLAVAQSLPLVSYDDQQLTFEESSDPWREALRALLGSISF